MPEPRSALEIYQLLEKSNCRECGEKTCLAFAGAVFTARRKLDECPKLDKKTIERFSPDNRSTPFEGEGQEFLKNLQKQIAGLDLSQRGEEIGGRFENGRLKLNILGKKFGVDAGGNLFADIHVNPWVAVPLLEYILQSRGIPPSGHWVSFRELKEGKERYPLFQKRCEETLKRVADIYTDLFDDIVHMFGGRQVERRFQADISVVLHPLPKVPFMICYWKPEEGLSSSLNVFFDRTADTHLPIGSIFSLGAGFARMITQLAHRHGFAGAG
jgi:hypothetical protein